MRVGVWIAAAPVVCVAACANVWGFSDVTLEQAAQALDASLGDAGIDRARSTAQDGAPDGPIDVASRKDSPGTADSGVDAGADGSGQEPDATDAGDDGSDGAPDARPACVSTGPNACVGCCDANGNCVGGLSNTTCGAGGASCVDCASVGQWCSGGSCSAVAPDAGSGCSLNPSSCNSKICLLLYMPCCKSDGTCGCQVSVPRGPCQ